MLQPKSCFIIVAISVNYPILVSYITASDVTKLVKIRIYRMRILTFEIRRMRLRIEAFYFISRNVIHWFKSVKRL